MNYIITIFPCQVAHSTTKTIVMIKLKLRDPNSAGKSAPFVNQATGLNSDIVSSPALTIAHAEATTKLAAAINAPPPLCRLALYVHAYLLIYNDTHK